MDLHDTVQMNVNVKFEYDLNRCINNNVIAKYSTLYILLKLSDFSGMEMLFMKSQV